MAAVDSKGGCEATRAASQIQKASGVAMLLHELDSIERFYSTNENGGGYSGGFADDVEHEVRAVIEENVGVALREIHGANARRGSAEMVTGGVTGRISFGFDDAATDAPGGKIVDNHFPDEEAGESYGGLWELRAAEAADGKLCVEFFHGDRCLWIGRIRRLVVEEPGEFGMIYDHRRITLNGVEVFFLEGVAGFGGHEHFPGERDGAAGVFGGDGLLGGESLVDAHYEFGNVVKPGKLRVVDDQAEEFAGVDVAMLAFVLATLHVE